MHSKDWSTIAIFNSYLHAYEGQSLEEVRDILMLDLQEVMPNSTMKQRDGI
jgi:hypothetical protein